ncbi:uncharacterized protein BXZ73DRAFT_76163 [Epithele typhae]|uniref:uncharacterized protein n=1 Tax=Epithele typhae TaxID=378194 RepID=UPI0020082977|nr:uncharacterized protein BXZ73DRAFT_76163 [Epithele typhae]KAH9939002.1 hypothetical protein BXZ73DRAFT_76163 [Epithele typhae]
MPTAESPPHHNPGEVAQEDTKHLQMDDSSAQQARMARLKHICDRYPPVANITPYDVPLGTEYISPSTNLSPDVVFAPDPEFNPAAGGPFLRNYGWAFTDKWAIEYAKKLKLTVDIDDDKPDFVQLLGGATTIDCASITDDSVVMQHKGLRQWVSLAVHDDIISDIEDHVGFRLFLGYPLSLDYAFMVVLFTNYNLTKRQWIIERVTRTDIHTAITTLSAIMAEPGEKSKEVMWWYAQGNPIHLGYKYHMPVRDGTKCWMLFEAVRSAPSEPRIEESRRCWRHPWRCRNGSVARVWRRRGGSIGGGPGLAATTTRSSKPQSLPPPPSPSAHTHGSALETTSPALAQCLRSSPLVSLIRRTSSRRPATDHPGRDTTGLLHALRQAPRTFAEPPCIPHPPRNFRASTASAATKFSDGASTRTLSWDARTDRSPPESPSSGQGTYRAPQFGGGAHDAMDPPSIYESSTMPKSPPSSSPSPRSRMGTTSTDTLATPGQRQRSSGMNYSRPVVAPVQEIDWDQSESRKRDVLLRNANARGPPSPSPTQSSSSQRAPKSPRLHGSSPLSSPALPTHPGSRPVSPASSVGSFPPNSPISPLTPPAALALAGTQRVVSASSVYSDYSYYELPATPTGGSYPVSAPSPRTSHANAKPQSDTLANPQTPQDFLQLGIKAHLENRLEASARAFERSATLDGGCGVGMLMWGLAQRHGWGCVQDEARGFAWLRRAAELAVGDWRRRGRRGILAQSGRSWCLRSTRSGRASFAAGVCEGQGDGRARLGDPDAQQELGFCLLNGRGAKGQEGVANVLRPSHASPLMSCSVFMFHMEKKAGLEWSVQKYNLTLELQRCAIKAELLGHILYLPTILGLGSFVGVPAATLGVLSVPVKVDPARSTLTTVVVAGLFPYVAYYCPWWPARAVERYTGPFGKTLLNPALVIGSDARGPDGRVGDSATLVRQNGFGHRSLAQASECTSKIIQDYLNNDALPAGDATVCEVDAVELFPGVVTSDVVKMIS